MTRGRWEDVVDAWLQHSREVGPRIVRTLLDLGCTAKAVRELEEGTLYAVSLGTSPATARLFEDQARALGELAAALEQIEVGGN